MNARYTRTPYCCGLMEIGDFGVGGANYYDYNSGLYEHRRLTKEQVKASRFAFICVTRKTDISQALTLRFWGFKKVGSWKNPNTNRTLTLWAYFPEKKKKTKKTEKKGS